MPETTTATVVEVTFVAVNDETFGAIGVTREDGTNYEFIFGAIDCAEQLAAFLAVPLTNK